MTRRFMILTVMIACAAIIPGSALQHAGAQKATVLRIATLAPSGSSWVKIFNAWNRSLQKETKNQVKLHLYPGGSQGDERDFVRKMRAGQMDGASVSVVGLSFMVRPVLVLAAPGLLTEYEKLYRARDKLDATFSKMFNKEGLSKARLERNWQATSLFDEENF